MELYRMNLQEIKEIYEADAVRDFPADELKPYSVIERLFQENLYDCYLAREDGENIAYAFFLRLPETESLLIDYFAVLPSYRCKGSGSRVLSLFREKLSENGGIIIEVEDPAYAPKEEKAIRLRRIAFYERNGARMTGLGSRVYTARYRVMYLPLSRDAEEKKVAEDLKELYSHIIPADRRADVFDLYPAVQEDQRGC